MAVLELFAMGCAPAECLIRVRNVEELEDGWNLVVSPASHRCRAHDCSSGRHEVLELLGEVAKAQKIHLHHLGGRVGPGQASTVEQRVDRAAKLADPRLDRRAVGQVGLDESIGGTRRALDVNTDHLCAKVMEFAHRRFPDARRAAADECPLADVSPDAHAAASPSVASSITLRSTSRGRANGTFSRLERPRT
jgi:hypothetical protein